MEASLLSQARVMKDLVTAVKEIQQHPQEVLRETQTEFQSQAVADSRGDESQPCAPEDPPPRLPGAPENPLERLVDLGQIEHGEVLENNLADGSDERMASSEKGLFKARRPSGGRSSEALEQFFANRLQTGQYGAVQDLEEHSALRILQLRSSKKAFTVAPPQTKQMIKDKPASSSAAMRSREISASPTSPSGMNRVGRKDKETMLSKCNRLTIEELRDNYDAVIVSKATLKSSVDTEMQTATALMLIPRILLAGTGILQFRAGRAWQMVFWCSQGLVTVIWLAAAIAIGLTGGSGPSGLATLSCFLVGVVAATISLRTAGISALLGPSDRVLDEYAAEAGFLDDWRKLSKRRFCEVVIFFLGMLAFKALVNFLSAGTIHRPGEGTTGVSTVFWHLSVHYVVLCYTALHVCCGLELAVDSFGLRFFKEMDMAEAVDEWNKVQAMLRQVSTKVSTMLVILTSPCLAFLVLVAESVFSGLGHWMTLLSRCTGPQVSTPSSACSCTL